MRNERVRRRSVPSEAFMQSVSEIRMRGYTAGYEAGWRDGYDAGKTDVAAGVEQTPDERSGTLDSADVDGCRASGRVSWGD